MPVCWLNCRSEPPKRSTHYVQSAPKHFCLRIHQYTMLQFLCLEPAPDMKMTCLAAIRFTPVHHPHSACSQNDGTFGAAL